MSEKVLKLPSHLKAWSQVTRYTKSLLITEKQDAKEAIFASTGSRPNRSE
jgi:hypothetical protein